MEGRTSIMEGGARCASRQPPCLQSDYLVLAIGRCTCMDHEVCGQWPTELQIMGPTDPTNRPQGMAYSCVCSTSPREPNQWTSNRIVLPGEWTTDRL